MQHEAESRYAWLRLWTTLALMTLGGAGMYAVTVALPPVQAEFGVGRSDASLPYTATMIGFGLGGIVMGRLADRFGVMVPVLLGSVCLGAGFIVAITSVTTQLQDRVPDQVRGRVMALWGVAFLGSRPLSAAIDGSIADLASPRAAALAMAAAAIAAVAFQGREAERPPARRPAELAGIEY